MWSHEGWLVRYALSDWTPVLIACLIVVLVVTLAVSGVIFRDDIGGRVLHWPMTEPVQLQVRRLVVPLSLHLEPVDPHLSSVSTAQQSTDVELCLSCECDVRVQLLWFVPFDTLSRLIHSVTQLDMSHYCGQSLSLSAGTHRVPLSSRTPLSQCAQSVYPLVAVVQAENWPTSPVGSQDLVTVMLAAIHLKHQRYEAPSRVLYRYIRCKSGTVSLFQPLYVGSDSSMDEEQQDNMTEDRSQDAGAHFGQCVVCAARSADTVLLPCRHACLCVDCFSHSRRINNNSKCPVCRGAVSHYWISQPANVAANDQRQMSQ